MYLYIVSCEYEYTMCVYFTSLEEKKIVTKMDHVLASKNRKCCFCFHQKMRFNGKKILVRMEWMMVSERERERRKLSGEKEMCPIFTSK